MATDYSYIASVEMWAGNYAPYGWAFCQGQTLAIVQYQPLFALIGTTYGGDGRNNFCLPDFRGRTVIGEGQLPGGSIYDTGEQGGSETIKLSTDQMPAHTHTAVFFPADATTLSASVALPVKTGIATGTNTPVNNYFGGSGTANLYFSDYTAGSTMAPVNLNISGQGTGGTVAIGSTGASNSFTIMQPFTVLNYIICFMGVFPPRS